MSVPYILGRRRSFVRSSSEAGAHTTSGMPRHNRHKGKRTAAARRKNRGASFEGEDGSTGLPRFFDGTADEHYYFDAANPFAHGSFGDAFFAVRGRHARVPLGGFRPPPGAGLSRQAVLTRSKT